MSSQLEELTEFNEEEYRVVRLDISLLVLSESPRLLSIDPAHAQLLAESAETLSPILVHRKTMQVVDGFHRVKAALIRGDREIHARFFDGDSKAAFVRSVELNNSHGLPLSLEDRHAAAKRILDEYPEWSDRAIAKVTGLSPKTIRNHRDCSTEASPQLNRRVGRDGRIRPLNYAEGRRRAAQVIEENPEASLREIARKAEISVGTARDVRKRILNGEDPVASASTGLRSGRRQQSDRFRNSDPLPILNTLKKDPALRYSDTGRQLIRWLDGRVVNSGSVKEIIDSVPPHCVPLVEKLAIECAGVWKRLSDELGNYSVDTETRP